MSVEQFITLTAALSLAILTPGPGILATVQAAFNLGRARALPYALGLAAGASLWCIFALAGLAVLFRLHPALFQAVRLLGGAYLIWFAWSLWRASTAPLPQAARGVSRGFLGGVVLNLSNPKPALFYATLILGIFPGPLSHAEFLLIYLVCLGTETFWYVLVSVAMSAAVMRRGYFAARFWIDRATALAMVLIALLLIFKT